MEESRFGINGFWLKLIAVITMLIDHTGSVLFPQYIELRYIGRIAFPIYCFLIVEGAMHTSDIKKYQLRLLLFAFISEIPFDLAHGGAAFDFQSQNVFFTLFLGLFAVSAIERYKRSFKSSAIVVLICLLSILLKTDYSVGGVCFILFFYIFYKNKIAQCISFALTNALVFGGIQNYALFSLIPIYLYNGKRGINVKYLFYIFYPAHLMILYIIKYYIL